VLVIVPLQRQLTSRVALNPERSRQPIHSGANIGSMDRAHPPWRQKPRWWSMTEALNMCGRELAFDSRRFSQQPSLFAVTATNSHVGAVFSVLELILGGPTKATVRST
jgi:hypothetical protein